jgi:DegV family protein with EDD domain
MNSTKIALVADSCIDLPKEYQKAENVRIVPLNITFPDGTTIQDGVDITIEEFYKRADEHTDLPVTSQPSPEQFLTVYEELFNNYEHIISMHLSSELSGTYNSAQLAKQMLDSDKKSNLHLLDTGFASLLEGFVYIVLLEAIKEGKEIKEVLEIANEQLNTMSTIFTVKTLENLKKGGRVSHLSAVLGGFLQIKPVMEIGCKTDGKIEALSKVRGRNKAISEMVSLVKERATNIEEQTIGIMHSIIDDEAELNNIVQKVKDDLNPKDVFISKIGSTIGTHTGVGAIGIVFSE